MPDEDTQDYINFDYNICKDLQVQYDIALKEGKEVFIFNNHHFVLGYAKYLLQYLNTKFKFKKDGVK